MGIIGTVRQLNDPVAGSQVDGEQHHLRQNVGLFTQRAIIPLQEVSRHATTRSSTVQLYLVHVGRR